MILHFLAKIFQQIYSSQHCKLDASPDLVCLNAKNDNKCFPRQEIFYSKTTRIKCKSFFCHRHTLHLEQPVLKLYVGMVQNNMDLFVQALKFLISSSIFFFKLHEKTHSNVYFSNASFKDQKWNFPSLTHIFCQQTNG